MSRKTLLLCLLFALALPPVAAGAAPSSGDPKVKAQLDALDYEYEVDEDGDFKLVFEVGDAGRSQVVYVLSEVESYGAHEVREIWSPAYESPADEFPAEVANRLLEASNRAKMGGWVKQGRNAVVVVKIDADAGKEALDDAMDIALRLGDEMESELTPGKDDF